MKIKQMLANKYAVIIEKDEMIIKSLTQFANNIQLGMAHFQMIGAITKITLGYIPKHSTDYLKKDFNEQYELLATMGSIIWDKDTKQPIIHCHATFGDENFKVMGGHLLEAKVAIKVEVIIEVISNNKVFQTIDNNINFNIWDLS